MTRTSDLRTGQQYVVPRSVSDRYLLGGDDGAVVTIRETLRWSLSEYIICCTLVPVTTDRDVFYRYWRVGADVRWQRP